MDDDVVDVDKPFFFFCLLSIGLFVFLWFLLVVHENFTDIGRRD